jgi:hypothetical protein
LNAENAIQRTQESVERMIASQFATQYGLISRDQALRAGASADAIFRRVAGGRWDRLYPGVFRIAGSPSSWRQAVLAACLARGKGTAGSHRTAAHLWKLPPFDPGPIEITIPRSRRLGRMPGVVVHRVGPLPPADLTMLDGIPVTSPARTLIDLTAVASRESVEEALDDALRRGLVSVARLRWRLNELRGSGRRGIATIRDLIEARGGGEPVPKSVFETRLVRHLRAAGLPASVRQHEIRDRGRLVARLDSPIRISAWRSRPTAAVGTPGASDGGAISPGGTR